MYIPKPHFFGASKMFPIVESLMSMYKWCNVRHKTVEAYSPSHIPFTLFKDFESQELSYTPPHPIPIPVSGGLWLR